MQRRSKFVKPTAYVLFFILLYSICELSIRIAYPNRLLPLDERNNLYQFDDKLGWFPKKNENVVFKGSREIKVKHNKFGFRDDEHGEKTKERILFIGDSFTWGYDVEEEERFTNLLQNRIENWEMLNLGVSGYGTDQAFILLQDRFDQYQPDIVFLTFCSNDTWENSSRVIYGGYYKPYYVLKESGIELHGVPVEKSYRYLFSQYPLLAKSRTLYVISRFIHEMVRPDDLDDDPTEAIFIAMKKYVEERGSKLIIGFTNADATSKETKWCKQNNIDYLLLKNTFIYPSNGNHWTPAGHQFVAEKIFSYLKINQPHIFTDDDSK